MKGKIKPIDNQPSIEKVSKKKTQKGKLRKADEQLAVGKVKKKLQLKSTIFAADEPTASGKVNKKAQYKGTVIPPEDLMPSGKITKKVNFFSKLAPVIQVAFDKIQVKCVNLLKAELDKEPVFFASILADGETLEYKILDGQIIESIKQYGGSVIELNQRLIFLHAVAKFCIKCNRALLTQAPAYTMEIDHSATIDNEAHMAQHPANEIVVDEKTRFTVTAKLIAYYKAQAVYVKKIFMPHVSKLEAVKGALLSYVKKVRMPKVSKLIAANSSSLSSKTKKVFVKGEYKATRANSATFKIRNRYLGFDHEATAVASKAGVAEIGSKTIKQSHVAKLIAYIKAQAVYVKKIFTPHVSKLIAAKSALISAYRETFIVKGKYNAIGADSAIVESTESRFVAGHEATGISAGAETIEAHTESIKEELTAVASTATATDIGILKDFKVEATAAASSATVLDVNINSLTKATHSAKMAAWGDPVLENGVLILRQAYSATQTDNVLEVF